MQRARISLKKPLIRGILSRAGDKAMERIYPKISPSLHNFDMDFPFNLGFNQISIKQSEQKRHYLSIWEHIFPFSKKIEQFRTLYSELLYYTYAKSYGMLEDFTEGKLLEDIKRGREDLERLGWDVIEENRGEAIDIRIINKFKIKGVSPIRGENRSLDEYCIKRSKGGINYKLRGNYVKEERSRSESISPKKERSRSESISPNIIGRGEGTQDLGEVLEGVKSERDNIDKHKESESKWDIMREMEHGNLERNKGLQRTAEKHIQNMIKREYRLLSMKAANHIDAASKARDIPSIFPSSGEEDQVNKLNILRAETERRELNIDPSMLDDPKYANMVRKEIEQLSALENKNNSYKKYYPEIGEIKSKFGYFPDLEEYSNRRRGEIDIIDFIKGRFPKLYERFIKPTGHKRERLNEDKWGIHSFKLIIPNGFESTKNMAKRLSKLVHRGNNLTVYDLVISSRHRLNIIPIQQHSPQLQNPLLTKYNYIQRITKFLALQLGMEDKRGQILTWSNHLTDNQLIKYDIGDTHFIQYHLIRIEVGGRKWGKTNKIWITDIDSSMHANPHVI